MHTWARGCCVVLCQGDYGWTRLEMAVRGLIALCGSEASVNGTSVDRPDSGTGKCCIEAPVRGVAVVDGTFVSVDDL
jgi:hypothetical protein